ncbi:MAG: bifunctional 5,10-methylene-tetrahydrofolate dehydrogenase/5,10-methylene-tetrahydrofolate cyclohydrolase [Candidatus Heimdallarchaeota archaeon]|nr:bifunctional 5,10-methylene-tetrahydrofolate dehydrogenase/5,10-methylene-tetrahydrofolate cyclohydrolase [Candidatus Heimdallarchaeota archaeon]
MKEGILDGKLLSTFLRAEIKQKVEALTQQPHLAAIIIGNDPASQMYVKYKQKACQQVRMTSSVEILSPEITSHELADYLDQLNQDKEINGILLQLPLPAHLKELDVLMGIDPSKDVDGLHFANVGKLHLGLSGFVPATPGGIMQMLKHSGTELKGQNVVVIGRSNLVGKPIARLLEIEHATVTQCHSRTQFLSEFTNKADILIAAAGKKHLITEVMVKSNSVIIDVGTNSVDGKLYGDVDFDQVKHKVKLISPVPGGVGPMTITMLLQNTLDAFNLQNV